MTKTANYIPSISLYFPGVGNYDIRIDPTTLFVSAWHMSERITDEFDIKGGDTEGYTQKIIDAIEKHGKTNGFDVLIQDRKESRAGHFHNMLKGMLMIVDPTYY